VNFVDFVAMFTGNYKRIMIALHLVHPCFTVQAAALLLPRKTNEKPILLNVQAVDREGALCHQLHLLPAFHLPLIQYVYRFYFVFLASA
jgi:hypothetical protein